MPIANHQSQAAANESRVANHQSRVASFPILLVEDKDSLRAMLRHALEAQGHTVVEACDEADAVQQLRQARPAGGLADPQPPTRAGLCVPRAAQEPGPQPPG